MQRQQGAFTVELKMPLAAGDRNGRLISEHLAADHRQRFALRRIGLAGHDRRSKLVAWKDQFAEAGARTRSHQANIVCDLEQGRSGGVDGAMREHKLSWRPELVGRAREQPVS